MNAEEYSAESQADARCVAMVRGELHYCSGRHCAKFGSHMPDDGNERCSECRKWFGQIRALLMGESA